MRGRCAGAGQRFLVAPGIFWALAAMPSWRRQACYGSVLPSAMQHGKSEWLVFSSQVRHAVQVWLMDSLPSKTASRYLVCGETTIQHIISVMERATFPSEPVGIDLSI